MKLKLNSQFSISFLFIFVACQGYSPAHQKIQNKSESKLFEFSEFETCLDRIDRGQNKYIQELNESYIKIDPVNGEIGEEKKSIFRRGRENKSAVLLMHGILSDPSSQEKLITELNQQGLTVLAPLITGFGSSSRVANAAKISNWQSSIDYHYKLLSLCFDHISLVGFSLGGALSTDFSLNRYPELYRAGKARLDSLVLLSPAIRPAEKWVPLKAYVTLLFGDEVPFWLISKLKKDPDIKEMMKEPEKYNQEFPVFVGLNLHRLSDILEKSSTSRFVEHTLPVSLDYSQADAATDWQETREFLTDHFFDVRIFSFTGEDNIAHTLELSSDTQTGKKIRQGLTRFILWYSQDEESRVNTYKYDTSLLNQ